eukprot:870177-Prymnesium_polylepis.1
MAARATAQAPGSCQGRPPPDRRSRGPRAALERYALCRLALLGERATCCARDRRAPRPRGRSSSTALSPNT